MLGPRGAAQGTSTLTSVRPAAALRAGSKNQTSTVQTMASYAKTKKPPPDNPGNLAGRRRQLMDRAQQMASSTEGELPEGQKLHKALEMLKPQFLELDKREKALQKKGGEATPPKPRVKKASATDSEIQGIQDFLDFALT